MRFLLILTVIPFCLTSIPKGIYFPMEETLTVFTDQTYKEIMTYYDTLFLIFYAPWCGMCERGIPQFEKISQELQSEFPNCLFAKVDCQTNREVRNHFEVTGYPTYLLIHKDKIMGEFFPSVTSPRIRNFIKDKTMFLGEEATTLKQIEDKISRNDVIIVYFGNEDKDISTISSSLLFHSNIPFVYCNTNNKPKIASKFKLKSQRTIKLFKQYDEREHELFIKGELKKEHVDELINVYSQPLIMKYNKETFDYVFTQHHSAIFFIQSQKDQFKSSDMLVIAKEFREKAKVVLIDSIDTEYNQEFLEKNNIANNDLPLIKYFYTINAPLQYPIPGPYDNITSIKEFISQLLDNKEKIKAESSSLSSVYVLTAHTFQKEVIDNGMDVLVKFYAPWCGHCKRLAPIYEQLAMKFADNAKIRIAEIDSTMHSIDSINIEGYPTIIFFPFGNKQNYIQYDGEGTLDEMIQFVNANAKNSDPSFQLLQ